MLTIRDSHHITTNRCVAGHRACRTNTGFSRVPRHGESNMKSSRLINRRFRSAWLIGQWETHLSRCAQRKG